MADRASGEDKPGVPKEVFELDKDERWQARLDEARARREIALREKAAGKPQKPRPKPWEVDGAAVDEPLEVEPIIQERGDDKFDFADRLETIRERGDEKTDESHRLEAIRGSMLNDGPVEPEPPFSARERPKRTLPSPMAKRSGKALEARARPQPSLILPGAPDVADLAARYAATLDTAKHLDIGLPDERLEEKPAPLAELVTLPRRQDVPQEAPERPLRRAERRRGIRPLGMALGLLGLAILPFGTEAPPLETGPDMPLVDVLGIQPALGVTWSLYQAPVQTRSGEWKPQAAPGPLASITVLRSVNPLDTVALPPLPPEALNPELDWAGIAPVAPQSAPRLDAPAAGSEDVPTATAAPERMAPPVATGVEPTLPVLDGGVSAPSRPATLVDDEEITPVRPQEPPEPRPADDTVVEAKPLRVTILAPARVDRALTSDIASRVQNDGHELVRLLDVEYSISDRNVRYFHEADREAAARMAERYDAELRDFTWFTPKPLDGTAELWLAGRSPSGNTSGRVPPVAESGGFNGDFLGQVFDRLGLGTELPDALPDDLRSILPGNQ